MAVIKNSFWWNTFFIERRKYISRRILKPFILWAFITVSINCLGLFFLFWSFWKVHHWVSFKCDALFLFCPRCKFSIEIQELRGGGRTSWMMQRVIDVVNFWREMNVFECLHFWRDFIWHKEETKNEEKKKMVEKKKKISSHFAKQTMKEQLKGWKTKLHVGNQR